LTEKAAETLASNGLRDTIFAPWGPDLSFKGYESVPPDQFRLVALGRTARDLDTLISAIGLENVDSILEVPSGTALPPGAVSLGDLASASGYTKFEEGSYLRPGVAFRQASVFAVPLHQGFGGPVGLTEANDALALGRPIIMTRTQGLGFDIEKEGMGIWVDPRDVEGWRNAIRLLRDDIGLRRQMGVNARRFAESQWNNTIFSTKLNAFLLQTGL
jgi:glycosyltransferase involved in cell wall biosynthesis